MVLSGLVNKRIVQAINDAGGRAVGISGKDDDLMVCVADDPELGFVGKPVEMNVRGAARPLQRRDHPGDRAGRHRHGGQRDLQRQRRHRRRRHRRGAEGRPAAAADQRAGVKDASGEVVTQMTPEQVRAMIADGTISGGMIPKVETALDAVDGGVRAAVILDGRLPNACLLELFTEHGAGSIIRSTESRVKPRADLSGHRHGGGGAPAVRLGRRAGRTRRRPARGYASIALLSPDEPGFWPHVDSAAGIARRRAGSARPLVGAGDRRSGGEPSAAHAAVPVRRPALAALRRLGAALGPGACLAGGLLVHDRMGLWASWRGALALPDALPAAAGGLALRHLRRPALPRRLPGRRAHPRGLRSAGLPRLSRHRPGAGLSDPGLRRSPCLPGVLALWQAGPGIGASHEVFPPMTTGTPRRLILTRHAKSAWDDPLLDDHDRPLNRRGMRAAL